MCYSAELVDMGIQKLYAHMPPKWIFNGKKEKRKKMYIKKLFRHYLLILMSFLTHNSSVVFLIMNILHAHFL